MKEMTITINKKNKDDLKKILKEKKDQLDQSGKLQKHFGKLKRKLDGLDYQTEIRENED
ncbi:MULTISPECIES: hypothetical protein [unclassified Algoriphagus]|jgi:hypothetical protein|uniref:hypothetical protein n=1 Tax=unclassified Algoriphagus TaxID=2641541 RepID=UPI001C629F12|nr:MULTISPECIES: hypothetical protein [unclassified Algoriphagus]QYH40653.1 hypothetical protein GYM62_18315 [Algoriphagus sp. NBT04N3]|tara:strand:- start:543 stop:719 length:177 start_codon:yes stop_codon:yes gene_type:complete